MGVLSTVCARLTVRSAPHRHERKFFGAHVCRVTFKHLPQHLRIHVLSFGTLGQLFKILYRKVKSIYRTYWSTSKNLINTDLYLAKSFNIKKMTRFTPHYHIYCFKFRKNIEATLFIELQNFILIFWIVDCWFSQFFVDVDFP